MEVVRASSEVWGSPWKWFGRRRKSREVRGSGSCVVGSLGKSVEVVGGSRKSREVFGRSWTSREAVG